jgi:Circularly permutated YpsA SLOG family
VTNQFLALWALKKLKIISSGQTAADRAVLAWAFEMGVERSGWHPKDENSLIEKYNLRQTPGSDPFQSIQWNVFESSGVAIINTAEVLSDCLQTTIELAQKYRRPLLHVPIEPRLAAVQLRDFVHRNDISALYIICHQQTEGELEHLLPLILTDAFCSALTLSTPDNSRRNADTVPVGTAPLTIDPANTKKDLAGWEAFQDLYLSMYRSWEGREEYAGKVRTANFSIIPNPTNSQDDFNILAAWSSLTQSNPAEAARYLELVSAGIREHPIIFWLSWSVYMANGNWQKMLETAQRHAKWQPEVAEGWVLWAIALDKMGQTQEAYALLASVLDRFQNNFNIAYNYACFACKSGRIAEAWTWVEKAFHLTDLETFKQWLLSDDDLKPLREKIGELSQTRLI